MPFTSYLRMVMERLRHRGSIPAYFWNNTSELPSCSSPLAELGFHFRVCGAKYPKRDEAMVVALQLKDLRVSHQHLAQPHPLGHRNPTQSLHCAQTVLNVEILAFPPCCLFLVAQYQNHSLAKGPIKVPDLLPAGTGCSLNSTPSPSLWQHNSDHQTLSVTGIC